MIFRNLTLFRFPLVLRNALAAIADLLPAVAMKPIGTYEMSTCGFVSPFRRDDDALSLTVGDCILLVLGGEQKILPASVVSDALAQQIEAVRLREGRCPGGRERKRLKDAVLYSLLPRAFARPSRVSAYLDLGLGWLVVDTSSRAAAEGVVAKLREALGSFPALPVNAESSVRALMTDWVGGEPLPDGFLLGENCELRDPVADGATVKCSHQELDSDEIREHLAAGKQAFAVELVFEDRLAFVLSDDLVIRRLRFLETATQAIESDEHDSVRAEIGATFALMTGELKRLLRRLEVELLLSSCEASHG